MRNGNKTQRQDDGERETKDTCLGAKIYRELASKPVRDKGVRREDR